MSNIALPARLRAYDHPRELAEKSFVCDVRATLLDKRNRRQPLLQSLKVLGQKRGEMADENAPLCCAWNNIYPDAMNAQSAYGGPTTNRRQLPRGAFGGNAYAMSHGLNDGTTSVEYPTNFVVPRNTPCAVRLWPFKPPKTLKFPVWGFRIDQWQIQATKKSAEIALRKPSWTQAFEDDINTARGADGYDDNIDEGRLEHYELFEDLPSGQGFDGAEFYDFTIIPEDGGALSIYCGNDYKRIIVPRLAELRLNDRTIYNASLLTFYCNGGAFEWQAGYPEFATEGSFTFPIRFVANHGDGVPEFADLIKRVITSEPAGTSVDIGVEDTGSIGQNDDGSESSQHYYNLKVTATTSNPRLTPFIYSAQIINPAKPRLGANGGLSYDTDDEANKITYGNSKVSAIEEVEASCDGDGWARSYDVLIFDGNGETMPVARMYEALEGRHAGLSVGGVQVLGSNGVVLDADRVNMKSVEYNQATGAAIARIDAKSRLTVTDGWPLLDEHFLRADVEFDDAFPGEGIRFLMSDSGWTNSEIARVSKTFGKRFPKAAPGEDPCVVARKNSSAGAVIREWMDKWTMGGRFWHDFDGVWETANLSEDVVLTLSRDAPMDSRLRYYGELDFTRDASNSFNEFLVIGGTDANGETLAASWTVYEGFRYGSNAQQMFVGRPRTYLPVIDSGLRNMDDVKFVLRSVMMRFGQPGRFVSTVSHFHQTLLTGQTIALTRESAPLALKPLKCRVLRINGAKASTDLCTLMLQEKVQRYGLEGDFGEG